jgi:hypothetical protein
MRRREFILGVGAATASPLAADAQRPTSCVSRVGLIVTFFTLTTVAAKQATSGDVPIGMAVRRPGRDGLVASLARPRGARPAIFPMSFAERSFIHWGTISLLSSLRARYGSTTHDQIRRVSGQCRLMAAKVTTPIDQAAWLELATDWLGLIPEPAQTASDRFDATERDRGTRQLRSSAEH